MTPTVRPALAASRLGWRPLAHRMSYPLGVDPWPFTLALLAGTFTCPAVRWPADRVRLVEAADEPDEVSDLTSSEVEVLEILNPAGELRAAEIAAALHVSAGTVHVRLHRMVSRGLLRRAGRGSYATRA